MTRPGAGPERFPKFFLLFDMRQPIRLDKKSKLRRPMPMRKIAVITFLGLLCPTVVMAQEYKVPRGATIYVEEMEHDLDGYIKA